jgi:4-hydroxy-4-methyl-2-oxoglutarate aldolase
LREPDLAEKLGKYATPTLFEVCARVGALAPTIVPLYRPIHLLGAAYCVLTSTGDNSAIHLALAKAPEGSVLVVGTGQDTQRGYWGEILMEAALARGIRGLIIDGGVRDTKGIRERSFPVFCASVAIAGTSKARSGVLNQPVMITQILIRPGDFIVGDDDGVVIIRPEDAIPVIEAAEGRVQKETQIVEKVRRGELTVNLFNLKSEV